MAKRSPILGYNHNVRYRGLVFHVQTEDSGLLSPHLFTHLFHGGVIISTRKLVYDSGAAEDAIKSLMQAQHKAVLKDLKKGTFDDKIDQYLGGTPGLLPRGEGEEDGRASEPSMATPPAGAPVVKPPVVTRAEPATSRHSTDADVPAFELAPPGSPAAKVARTKTAERGSAPSQVRTNLPPPPPSAEELGGPTLDDGDAASIAAAIAAANATIPNRMPTNDATIPVEMPEMSPLEIELDLDEPEDQPRAQVDNSATIRNIPGDSVPPLPAPPQRAPSSVGAAALPPRAVTPSSKLPSRPAITPPQVVSRPIAARDEDKSGAVEVYAPPPPGAEPPPGVTLPPGASDSSRPGQYSQHKRASQKVPVIESYKDPIPSGLGRPKQPSGSPSQSQSSGIPRPVGRDSSSNQVPPSRQTGSTPVVRASDSNSGTARSDSGATVSGMGRAGSGSNPGTGRDASGSRPIAASTTQPRISGSGSQPGTQPRIAGTGSQPGTQRDTGSRPGTQQPRDTGSRPGTAREPSSSRTSSSSSSSGVVMTRPAVIVGAPAKPNQPQRVRKAREEEGRGFGQGLISEKSLDEVILAYLSEDADEK